MTIAELKAKYASISNAAYAKPPRARTKDGLSEIARAALLKNVVDALVARCDPAYSFRLWHRHGLSRIYFVGDNSWLSYSARGISIYGPGKESIAYEVRCALRLKTSAKRYVEGLES